MNSKEPKLLWRARFEQVLDLYSSAIKRLSQSQSLDVISCCLPYEVITTCWSLTRKLTSVERENSRRQRGQRGVNNFHLIPFGQQMTLPRS